MRVLLFVLGSLVLLACEGDSSPGNSAVDAPSELGEFAVGHSTFTAVDAARGDRSLLIDLWYPVDEEDAADAAPRQYTLSGIPGPVSEVAFADPPISSAKKHPLLVFSHGYGGISTQSIGLMEILASHGFIIASPEHTGNAQQSATDSFDEAAANRVPDVSFVVDTVLAAGEDPEAPFFGRVEEERIGVVGHSFGGMTAIGTTTGWAGAAADPRVDAILPVSAVIHQELQSDERNSPNAGFTSEQLERITVPVMLMGGTRDVDVFIENNEIAYEQIVNAPHVYRVDIIGANHTHFANVCQIGDFLIESGVDKESWPILGAEDLIEPYDATCGPEAFPIDEANRLQNLYTVAFFKRHLVGDLGYDAFLTEEFANTEPAVELFRK
jgi:predicted dienelactone hydrolase